MAPRKLAAKKRAQADLKQLNAIQITIEASEGTLQRLAALLLFADHLQPDFKVTPTQLPWEEPGVAPPELEIDYEKVRRDIATALGPYVVQHGEDAARRVIQSFGGERLRDVPEPQLIGLWQALAGEAAGA